MKTNRIIEELRAIASLPFNPEQKAYYEKRVADARVVECVPMRDAFTPDQLRFLFQISAYKTQQKQCFKNASLLVEYVDWMATHYDSSTPAVKYVEGFAYAFGLLPIEHAFVKVGDVYVDPTFERALHLNVRNEQYVALIELDCDEMCRLQADSGYYGGLYEYLYRKQRKNRAPDASRARRSNTESDTR